MYAGRCWTFEEVLGVCSPSGGLSQEPHSDTHHGWKTPYEAWHGRKPSLKHLREFGCLAFVHIAKEKRKKLDYRPTPGIFIGYSTSTKQYFEYDPLARTLHRS